MASLNDLYDQKAALQAQLNELSAENKRGNLRPYTPQWEALQQQIRGLESQIVGIDNEIATASAGATGTSSGQVVAQQQVAKDDGALTQDPQAPAGRVFKPDELNRNLETGTNAPVRTLNQTQATPPADPNSTEPTVSTAGGSGAARDDNTGPNKNATQQTVNASFSQKITPRANALDLYASYTYSISWYLLTPQQYNQAMSQQRKDVSRWSLLVQSGGAPVETDSANQAGRNQFFNVDYYIDNLVIESNFTGKGSGAARGVTEMTFQVTEPNGITLIPTLYNAVTTLYRNQNPPIKFEGAWQQAQYCLCIRFYGYDEAGNLVQAGRSGSLGAAPNPSDPVAGIEKYIPFTITELTSKIVSKQIVYDFKTGITSESTGFATNRGTIPFAYELTGTTVGEVLNGRATTAATNAAGRPNAADIPAQPVTITGSANQDVGGGTIFSTGVSA